MEITEDTCVEDIVCALQQSTLPRAADGWWSWDNVQEAHRRLAQTLINNMPAYPGRYSGRGIVIAAGGHRLFTCAYVCASMLRHLGCILPIQFWHFRGEIDERMRRIVAPLGVACIDANEVEESVTASVRPLKKGWELKPFALLHCPYRDVMLLDADNVAVIDPTFLFDTRPFRETGAIFWPDYGRLEPWRQIWTVSDVSYRDDPQLESGQIVIDKERCWDALNLAMHYNDHSDFYYHFVHGDKDTFHFAWRRLGKEYAMPDHAIHSLDATMCQHDFDGLRLFQHRNMDKWKLDGSNRRVEDFWFEDDCRRFLSELYQRWPGRVFWNVDRDPAEATVFARVAGKVFRYERVGYDERTLQLIEDGAIGEGSADRERYWSVNTISGRLVLSILGTDSVTCHLSLEGDTWKGRWLDCERMPIELQEIEVARIDCAHVATGTVRAVVTVSTGDFRILEPITLPSFLDYSRRWGADLVVSRRTLATGNGQWDKLLIGDILNYAEKVVYVDLDSVIRPDTPDLFSLVPDGQFAALDEGEFLDEAGLRHRRAVAEALATMLGLTLPGWSGTSYWNTGVMIFDRSHRHLFERPQSFPPDSLIEQSWINLQLAWRATDVMPLDRTFNMFEYDPPQDWEGSYILHSADGNPARAKMDRLQGYRRLASAAREK
jgi:Mannosyltransferase putative